MIIYLSYYLANYYFYLLIILYEIGNKNYRGIIYIYTTILFYQLSLLFYFS